MTLRLYKVDASGSEINYYTYFLRDVYIKSISEEMPLMLDTANENYYHMERISFTYGRYSEEFEETGAQGSDEWTSSCPQNVLSDLNFDGTVNLKDYAIMADEWLR
ncbi:MAG: hypothetical protein A2Y07_11160 [Planctomycetes bacterium GWF2_50_10]|nr:MAG: hypothetical protein A2Y07_11160 [Planctomycetes bacterium GWF2_50_10]